MKRRRSVPTSCGAKNVLSIIQENLHNYYSFDALGSTRQSESFHVLHYAFEKDGRYIFIFKSEKKELSLSPPPPPATGCQVHELTIPL